MKLTKKQQTALIQKYARKHGYSTSTVRTCTCLRYAALTQPMKVTKNK